MCIENLFTWLHTWRSFIEVSILAYLLQITFFRLNVLATGLILIVGLIVYGMIQN